MTETGDGVEDGLTTSVTVALSAAARAGEQLARLQEQHHRAVQAQTEQAGQQLAQRLEAEQQAAAAYFAAVSHPEYLEHASQQELANAYQQAAVWRDTDPGAAQAEQILADRYRQRFGAEPTPRSSDQATTVALVAGAEAADRTIPPEWDSRQRREQLADTLHATVDNPVAVQARLAADTANAHPPHNAVRAHTAQVTSPHQGSAPARVPIPGVER